MRGKYTSVVMGGQGGKLALTALGSEVLTANNNR